MYILLDYFCILYIMMETNKLELELVTPLYHRQAKVLDFIYLCLRFESSIFYQKIIITSLNDIKIYKHFRIIMKNIKLKINL